MNPAIKEAWARALESGSYRRGTGYLLRNREGKFCFCPLGVLCDLHHIETAADMPWRQHPIYKEAYSYLGALVFPPPEVEQWANLPDDYATVALMDARGASFEKIAAFIRKRF